MADFVTSSRDGLESRELRNRSPTSFVTAMKMRIAVIAGGVWLILLAGFLFRPWWVERREAKQWERESAEFKMDLAAAIRAADSVIIVEHSWPHDVPEELKGIFDPADIVEYKRKALSKEEGEKIALSLEALSPVPREPCLCTSPSHHSIELHSKGKRTDLLLVRIVMGESEWWRETPDGLRLRDSPNPKGLALLLKDQLSDLGFRTRLDWEAELVRHLVASQGTSPPGEVSRTMPEPSASGSVD